MTKQSHAFTLDLLETTNNPTFTEQSTLQNVPSET
jgi:hypothetical protein